MNKFCWAHMHVTEYYVIFFRKILLPDALFSAAQLSKLYKIWSLWSRHFLSQYNINDWYNIFVRCTLPTKGQWDGFLGLGMFFQILSDLHMSWDKTSCSSVSHKLHKFVFPMEEVHLWTHWVWTTVYLEIYIILTHIPTCSIKWNIFIPYTAK
jgi:hypothetical protein